RTHPPNPTRQTLPGMRQQRGDQEGRLRVLHRMRRGRRLRVGIGSKLPLPSELVFTLVLLPSKLVFTLVLLPSKLIFTLVLRPSKLVFTLVLLPFKGR